MALELLALVGVYSSEFLQPGHAPSICQAPFVQPPQIHPLHSVNNLNSPVHLFFFFTIYLEIMAATIPQHLQIINTSYPAQDRGHDADSDGPLFSRFSQLPPELRLRIWHSSLEDHRRWLKIDIATGPLAPPVLYTPPAAAAAPEIPAYSTRNQLGNVISGRSYIASTRGLQLHSKLLRTSREARGAALRFYRVHIPLHFWADPVDRYLPLTTLDRHVPVLRGTLYSNPEHDVVQLSSTARGDADDQHPLLDFIHDLKAYDPRGIGICNLALGSCGMRDLHSLAKQRLDAPAVDAFVDCVSRLQGIIWMAESFSGRAFVGWRLSLPRAGVHFNHSMPIRGASPRFDLVGRDPRPVGPELKHVVTTSTNPRQMHIWWHELLERWEIRPVRPIKERVLFAHRTDWPSAKGEVWDAQSAHDFLKEEENSWIKSQLSQHGFIRQLAGRVPIEGPNELANATRPAVGFWLFPVEALGDDGEIVVDGTPRRMFDLTGHWPELALSRLW